MYKRIRHKYINYEIINDNNEIICNVCECNAKINHFETTNDLLNGYRIWYLNGDLKIDNGFKNTWSFKYQDGYRRGMYNVGEIEKAQKIINRIPKDEEFDGIREICNDIMKKLEERN